MKKYFLTVVMAFSVVLLSAQEGGEFGFAKGDFIVEGNLGLNSNTQDNGSTEVKTNSFNFSPKAGFFIIEDLAIGATILVGNSKEETTTGTVTNESKINGFGGGVFARYYFLDLGKRFKTYSEAEFLYASEKTESNNQELFTDKGFSLGVNLGLNYFITENIAINFALVDVLSYANAKREFAAPGVSETKVNEFNANINVFNNFFDTAQFGLTWKF